MDVTSETYHYINDIYVNIERINNYKCALYFTDKNRKIINIPEDTIICGYYESYSSIIKPDMERYLLSYEANYELRIKNEKSMYITNNRKWSVEMDY